MSKIKQLAIVLIAVSLGACTSLNKQSFAPFAPKAKRPITTTSFNKVISHVITAEGGYSSKENDATGEVRYGITGTTARRFGYRGSMRKLPLSTAKRIYKKHYWDKLPGNVKGKAKFVLFDAAVNQGPGYARKLARQSKGDVKKMIQLRKSRYYSIAKRKPHLKKFLKGWINRMNKVEKLVKNNKV